MAHGFKTAFGQYLRVLRARKGLSLGEVEALSEDLSERVERGNLSRCEHGRQALGLSKLIPLSRIYEVPTAAIVDRIELDLEVARSGGPDTESMDRASMSCAGSTAARREGRRLEAYAWFRDALAHEGPDRLVANDAEIVLDIAMSCATAALRLGRMHYALHEFSYVESVAEPGSRVQDLALNRIATAHSAMGNLVAARRIGERAIEAARTHGDADLLAVSLSALGSFLVDADPQPAIRYLQEGLSVHRSATDRYDIDPALADRSFEARTFINLAVCYLNLGRLGAARSALRASRRVSAEAGLRREIAVSHLLTGRLQDRQHRARAAVRSWRRAAEIARAIEDKPVRFNAELELFRDAVASGRTAAIRASARRLERLAPAVSHRTADVARFHELLRDHADLLTTRPATGEQRRATGARRGRRGTQPAPDA